MATNLADASGASMTVRVGELSLKLGRLTLKEIGLLERWSQECVLSRVQTLIDVTGPENYGVAMTAALGEAARCVFGTPSFAAEINSAEGLAKLLKTASRTSNPSVSVDDILRSTSTENRRDITRAVVWALGLDVVPKDGGATPATTGSSQGPSTGSS